MSTWSVKETQDYGSVHLMFRVLTCFDLLPYR